MSKFAKFTLIKFVLPTDTSSEEFCTAYYFLHGSLEGKFSVVKSCNTILPLPAVIIVWWGDSGHGGVRDHLQGAGVWCSC